MAPMISQTRSSTGPIRIFLVEAIRGQTEIGNPGKTITPGDHPGRVGHAPIGAAFRARCDDWNPGVRLDTLNSPHRSLVHPAVCMSGATETGRHVAVLLTEVQPRRWRYRIDAETLRSFTKPDASFILKRQSLMAQFVWGRPLIALSNCSRPRWPM